MRPWILVALVACPLAVSGCEEEGPVGAAAWPPIPIKPPPGSVRPAPKPKPEPVAVPEPDPKSRPGDWVEYVIEYDHRRDRFARTTGGLVRFTLISSNDAGSTLRVDAVKGGEGSVFAHVAPGDRPMSPSGFTRAEWETGSRAVAGTTREVRIGRFDLSGTDGAEGEIVQAPRVAGLELCDGVVTASWSLGGPWSQGGAEVTLFRMGHGEVPALPDGAKLVRQRDGYLEKLGTQVLKMNRYDLSEL